MRGRDGAQRERDADFIRGLRALAEQYIGESKAAELMNMPLESFRSLRAMESQDVAHHQ